jgi:hypothetical protein
VVRWVLFGLALVMIGSALWIGIRGLIARDALLGAVPLVEQARTSILAGDTEAAKADLSEIQQRAGDAAGLTGDPIWRVAEVIPLAGPNLTAFREAAQVIDGVARDALPPLAELADGLDLAAFVPSGGVLDTGPMEDAVPLLSSASEAMTAARESALAIRTDNTIPQIGEAVDQLVRLVDDTSGLVQGVSGAAEILPAMLGQGGPRDYLLLVLNNAELRAAGGIPGALDVIHADGGRISLGQQTTAASFGARAEPLPISDTERILFGDNLGLYMQNVTTTPDFARTAELATARWSERFGGAVDGVLSVDPVALSYILSATGPVDVGDGVVLDSDNVVQALLSDAYVRYPDPADQDAFFARAASAVFDRIAAGDIEPKAFIDALVRAGEERRILVWSAHDDEQAVIARGRIGGLAPEGAEDELGIGVYLHDSTESKMDWYLRSSIDVGTVECRNDDRPYYEVQVTLESTAPMNAAEALPDYVTGARSGLGLLKGQIRTGVFAYFPTGSVIYEAAIDGRPWAFSAADDGRNAAAGLIVDLDPGESAVLSFRVLGQAGWPLRTVVDHTPTAFETPVSTGRMLECPALPSDPGIQALAR